MFYLSSIVSRIQVCMLDSKRAMGSFSRWRGNVPRAEPGGASGRPVPAQRSRLWRSDRLGPERRRRAAHACTDGDVRDTGSIIVSLVYFSALAKERVPVEMHLYANGGHAFGLRRRKLPIADCRLPIADCRLASTGGRLVADDRDCGRVRGCSVSRAACTELSLGTVVETADSPPVISFLRSPAALVTCNAGHASLGVVLRQSHAR